ncbi:hypothetical protein GCM10011608_48780 [Micromonospora sonchi]|uniref:DUF4139 domain-containing protein n=1 Tax=Micromonospora sonchi TaxID=1763543 RepID=A0A917U6Q3_9ACTN|nr:hypothetical protein GCM10011608_48780 [Micromonospora sonchi]
MLHSLGLDASSWLRDCLSDTASPVPRGIDSSGGERTELGELTWRLSLAPGESGEVALGFRVDLAKGVELTGWRE